MKYVVILAVIAGIMLVGFQFVGAHMADGKFKNSLDEISSSSMTGLNDSEIKSAIERAASEAKLEIYEDGIQVKRSSAGQDTEQVIIDVDYLYVMNFFGKEVIRDYSLHMERKLTLAGKTMRRVRNKIENSYTNRARALDPYSK